MRIAGQVVSLGKAAARKSVFIPAQTPAGRAGVRCGRAARLAADDARRQALFQAYEMAGNTGTEITVSSRGEATRRHRGKRRLRHREDAASSVESRAAVRASAILAWLSPVRRRRRAPACRPRRWTPFTRRCATRTPPPRCRCSTGGWWCTSSAAVDPTVEAYAFRHLPFDMDLAVATQWKLETRRSAAKGNERWVLSTYRVTESSPTARRSTR